MMTNAPETGDKGVWVRRPGACFPKAHLIGRAAPVTAAAGLEDGRDSPDGRAALRARFTSLLMPCRTSHSLTLPAGLPFIETDTTGAMPDCPPPLR